jgi:hypothetical protein
MDVVQAPIPFFALIVLELLRRAPPPPGVRARRFDQRSLLRHPGQFAGIFTVLVPSPKLRA